MNHRSRGFSIVELIAAIVFVALAGLVVLMQRHQLDTTNRDAQRKTAMNALYYNLTQSYFPTHKSYPQVLTAATVPGLDPALLKDPEGHAIGEQSSDYRYEPTGCDQAGNCAGFTLRAKLEVEADFVKST